MAHIFVGFGCWTLLYAIQSPGTVWRKDRNRSGWKSRYMVFGVHFVCHGVWTIALRGEPERSGRLHCARSVERPIQISNGSWTSEPLLSRIQGFNIMDVDCGSCKTSWHPPGTWQSTYTMNGSWCRDLCRSFHGWRLCSQATLAAIMWHSICYTPALPKVVTTRRVTLVFLILHCYYQFLHKKTLTVGSLLSCVYINFKVEYPPCLRRIYGEIESIYLYNTMRYCSLIEHLRYSGYTFAPTVKPIWARKRRKMAGIEYMILRCLKIWFARLPLKLGLQSRQNIPKQHICPIVIRY